VQERAPWVPAEVAAIVHQALAFDASARYQTAAEMLAAITALLPKGASLRDSMLSGVSPETKSVVSAKLAQMTAPLMTPVPRAPTTGATAMSLTNGSPVVLPMRSAWRLALPITLVVVGAAALGIYLSRTKNAAHADDGPPAPLHSSPPIATMDPSPAALPSVTASSATASGKDEVDAAVRSASSLNLGAAPAPVETVAARPRPTVTAIAPPAPAAPNCDPPYTFNADGKKIWKRECL